MRSSRKTRIDVQKLGASGYSVPQSKHLYSWGNPCIPIDWLITCAPGETRCIGYRVTGLAAHSHCLYEKNIGWLVVFVSVLVGYRCKHAFIYFVYVYTDLSRHKCNISLYIHISVTISFYRYTYVYIATIYIYIYIMDIWNQVKRSIKLN